MERKSGNPPRELGKSLEDQKKKKKRENAIERASVLRCLECRLALRGQMLAVVLHMARFHSTSFSFHLVNLSVH